jgi:hypothetical protein
VFKSGKRKFNDRVVIFNLFNYHYLAIVNSGLNYLISVVKELGYQKGLMWGVPIP